MGSAMLAAAVLDIVLESTTVKRVAAKVIGTTPLDGTSPVIPSPTTCANPVAPDRAPSDSPPPNSRIVPQSICAACLQVMVERRVALMGSRKSRIAPVNAATASGTLDRTPTATGWSRPRNRGSMPGTIHSDTVTPNAITAFRSPGFQGPRARRRSAMIRSAPGISRTPVRPARFRTRNAMPMKTVVTGTPTSIHSTNEILTPSCSPSMPMAMMFGGVPTGVAIPPITEP